MTQVIIDLVCGFTGGVFGSLVVFLIIAVR